MVLFSTAPEYFLSFCGKNGVSGCSSGKSSSRFMEILFYFFLRIQISLPFNRRMGRVSTFISLILKIFWTKVGLNSKKATIQL